MRFRPAPTTTIAGGLLVALATLPFHDVFGDWDWALSVVGAAIVAAAVASAAETLRPQLPLPALAGLTALGAAAWGLLVSLREEFWSAPGSSRPWRDLADGVFNGWGALLDEQFPLTDPQGAEVFVAALVWVAAAVAVHVAARTRSALGAIAVGAGVLGISSAAALPRGLPPAVFGAVVGMLALVAVATITRAPDQQWRVGRIVALCGLIGLAGLTATVAGLATASIDRSPLDPRSTRRVDTVRIEVPDILAEFGPRRTGDDTVLTIDSSTPPAGLRLRLQVYDEHDGERWIPATGFEEVATFPDALELPPGDVVTLGIELEDLGGPWLPVPDHLIAIDVPDVRWNEEAQTMIREQPPAGYELTGTLVSRADVEGLAGGRDLVPERTSDLPAGFPDSIREAALEAAADTDDAIGAIDAITTALRTLGRDDTTPPGNSLGRLRDDLEAGEPTGAEQIASLHALMLRSVGIPSRLVVGYVANDAVVVSSDLHVWVEAAFEGVGWVAIDPVPTTSVSGDETETETTTPTTTAAPDARLQARALPRELGPGEDPDADEIGADDPFTRTDLLTLAIGAVAGVLVLLVAIRLIRRRVRRSSGWRAEVRVLGAWAELVDRLRELGAPITDTTTTGDVVFMAAAIDTELGRHAEALADLAAIALHAPHGSDPEEATEAWEHLQLAETRITEVRGRLVVPRRYLDPRVLRHRAPRPPDSRNGGRRSPVRPSPPS